MLYGHDKVNILMQPSQITYLKNVSEDLGINLYLKRDDITALGTGGNKLRKLEYLVKDALNHGATMLLTTGGAQTNHGRLTAASAARYGLKSAIVAVDEYPGEISANLILDGIMNCNVYLVHNDGTRTKQEVAEEAFAKITKEWEDKGEKVYFICTGGSNNIGMLGYYDCALELDKQLKEMKLEDPRVITTVGSMGTYMGLFAGQKNEDLGFRLTGIAIEPFPDGIEKTAIEYYNSCKNQFGMKFDAKESDFDLTCDYHRGAYNNPCKEVREAIYYLGSKEGIIMDPCYTGKTFAGILEMVEKGEIAKGENVVMIHTGGIPGIYTKHHRLEFEKELEKYIHII
jgi:1-aminocyclopropane-1-carboxylate deaminase